MTVQSRTRAQITRRIQTSLLYFRLFDTAFLVEAKRLLDSQKYRERHCHTHLREKSFLDIRLEFKIINLEWGNIYKLSKNLQCELLRSRD